MKSGVNNNQNINCKTNGTQKVPRMLAEFPKTFPWHLGLCRYQDDTFSPTKNFERQC